MTKYGCAFKMQITHNEIALYDLEKQANETIKLRIIRISTDHRQRRNPNSWSPPKPSYLPVYLTPNVKKVSLMD